MFSTVAILSPKADESLIDRLSSFLNALYASELQLFSSIKVSFDAARILVVAVFVVAAR